MTPDLTPFNAAAAEALAVYDYGGIGTWLGLDNSTRVGHIAYWTPVAEVAVAAVYELIAAQVREESQAEIERWVDAHAVLAREVAELRAALDIDALAAHEAHRAEVERLTALLHAKEAWIDGAKVDLDGYDEARAALAQVRDLADRWDNYDDRAKADAAAIRRAVDGVPMSPDKGHVTDAAYRESWGIAHEGTQTEAPPRRSVPMTQDKGQATDSPDPDAPLRIETTEGRASDPRPDWLKRQEPDPRIASVALAVASSYEWARIAVEALDRYDADNSPASRDAKWIRFHDADLGERIAQAIDQAWAVTKDRVKPDGCDEYLDGYLAGLEYAESLARTVAAPEVSP